MQKTLFIGNGINLLSGNGQSWHGVLSSLAQLVEKQFIMELSEYKPFTLIFEEISLRASAYVGKNEIELKKHVASLVKQIVPNNHHHSFLTCGVRNIITTNYDYSFELTANRFEKANLARETKYSLFRRNQVADTYVWHIHGEADVANSITLGHEQYSGLIQKMRNYLTADRIENGGQVSPFKLGNTSFETNERTYSWIDIFLRDEVHIIGFGFDYTEIDLWWLLSYKERLKQRGTHRVGTTYYHHFYDRQIEDDVRAKQQILESLGVTVVNTNVNGDYRHTYSDFLRSNFLVAQR